MTDGAQFQLGGGRQLPNLLFVTNRAGLAANIGQPEAERVLDGLPKTVVISGKEKRVIGTQG